MIKVFMAEDDPLMIRIYDRMFKSSGLELNAAFDGEDAMTKLKSMETKPDIVLLDIMMPKKGGFEVLEEMKKDESLKAIPVIMLTNLAGFEDEKKGLTLGATAYMVKSQHSPKEIVDKVNEVYSNIFNKKQ